MKTFGVAAATGVALLFSSSAFANGLLNLGVNLGGGDRVVEREYFVNPQPVYVAPPVYNEPCYNCATTAFVPPPAQYEYYEYSYGIR